MRKRTSCSSTAASRSSDDDPRRRRGRPTSSSTSTSTSTSPSSSGGIHHSYRSSPSTPRRHDDGSARGRRRPRPTSSTTSFTFGSGSPIANDKDDLVDVDLTLRAGFSDADDDDDNVARRLFPSGKELRDAAKVRRDDSTSTTPQTTSRRRQQQRRRSSTIRYTGAQSAPPCRETIDRISAEHFFSVDTPSPKKGSGGGDDRKTTTKRRKRPLPGRARDAHAAEEASKPPPPPALQLERTPWATRLGRALLSPFYQSSSFVARVGVTDLNYTEPESKIRKDREIERRKSSVADLSSSRRSSMADMSTGGRDSIPPPPPPTTPGESSTPLKSPTSGIGVAFTHHDGETVNDVVEVENDDDAFSLEWSYDDYSSDEDGSSSSSFDDCSEDEEDEGDTSDGGVHMRRYRRFVQRRQFVRTSSGRRRRVTYDDVPHAMAADAIAGRNRRINMMDDGDIDAQDGRTGRKKKGGGLKDTLLASVVRPKCCTASSGGSSGRKRRRGCLSWTLYVSLALAALCAVALPMAWHYHAKSGDDGQVEVEGGVEETADVLSESSGNNSLPKFPTVAFNRAHPHHKMHADWRKNDEGGPSDAAIGDAESATNAEEEESSNEFDRARLHAGVGGVFGGVNDEAGEDTANSAASVAPEEVVEVEHRARMHVSRHDGDGDAAPTTSQGTTGVVAPNPSSEYHRARQHKDAAASSPATSSQGEGGDDASIPTQPGGGEDFHRTRPHKSSEPTDTTVVDVQPILQTVEDKRHLYTILLRVSTKEDLANPGSPQYRSMDWISSDPVMMAFLKDGPEKAESIRFQGTMLIPSVLERYAAGVLFHSTGGGEGVSSEEEEESGTKTSTTTTKKKQQRGWNVDENWVSRFHICDWHGLSCEADGHRRVTSINLAENNLRGPFPVEMQAFDEVTVLNLNNNRLTGVLPLGIFHKMDHALREVSMVGNRLRGRIPDDIGDSSMLEKVAFSYNRLSGSLPPSLSDLSYLKDLRLTNNNLGGVLGDVDWSRLSNLKVLLLDHNAIGGTIAPSLGGNTDGGVGSRHHLAVLRLSHNKLVGTIPNELERLKYLVELDVRGNELRGEVPESLRRSARMERLILKPPGNEGLIV